MISSAQEVGVTGVCSSNHLDSCSIFMKNEKSEQWRVCRQESLLVKRESKHKRKSFKRHSLVRNKTWRPVWECCLGVHILWAVKKFAQNFVNVLVTHQWLSRCWGTGIWFCMSLSVCMHIWVYVYCVLFILSFFKFCLVRVFYSWYISVCIRHEFSSGLSLICPLHP